MPDLSAAATWLTVAATFALFYVTWKLARYTKELAKHTQRLADETTRLGEQAQRALVQAAVEPSMTFAGRLDLVITNSGGGSARDMKIEVWICPVREHRQQTPYMSVRLGSMLPGASFRFPLTMIADHDQSEVTAEVAYADGFGTARLSITQPLAAFIGWRLPGQTPEEKIAEHVKRIADALGGSGSLARLKVDVYTEADRQAEWEAHEARWRSQERGAEGSAPSEK
jgi:hypothetical protein